MTTLKTELIGEIARRAGADADAEQEASARKQGPDDKVREFAGQLRELENTIRRASERISEQIRARLKAMEPKNKAHRDRG